MNNITKDQLDSHDICKKSPVKPDRDLYRVCPSKLSKRELENLYFSLLENNIELKKTLHAQKEKLKVLSTKVQRLTVVQRNAAGKEKDGSNNKIIFNEQKDIIEDLKKANEQMAERIRLLNMRLCSAKQFLRRSSSQILKCPKCNNCPLVFKSTSTNNLSSKANQGSTKMTSTSSQYIPSEAPDADLPESLKPTRNVETETVAADFEKGTEKQCNENKCITVMEELKQKIVDLQEELSKTHEEYSKRISKLESDVSGLYQENIQVKAAAEASEHALQVKEKDSDALKGTLRDSEGTVNDLKMQLSIERRKVKELETALRLANKPSQVATIIEKMNNTQDVQAKSQPCGEFTSGSMTSYYSTKQDVCDPALTCNENCGMLSSPNTEMKEDTNISKSDDSGYADPNKSSDAEDLKVQTQLVEHANQEILKKISELQMQLDTLRIKAVQDRADNSEVDCVCKKPIPEKDINTSTPVKYNEAEASTSLKPEPDATLKGLDMENISNKKDEEFVNDINNPKNQLTLAPVSEKSEINGLRKDDDNRYQIPGPIPSTCSYPDKKNTLQVSKRASKDRDKKIDCKGKCVKISRSDNGNSDKEKNKDVKSNYITTPKGSPVKIADPAKPLGQKIIIVDPKASEMENEDDNEVQDNTFEAKKFRDSIIVYQKRLTKELNEASEDVNKSRAKEMTDEMAEVKKESLTSFYNRSNTTVTQEPPHSQQMKKEDMMKDDMKKDDGMKTKLVVKEATVPVPVLEQCLSRATICRCPKLTRREVNVFRTCSGTLRFHTTGTGDKFRTCSCPVDTNGIKVDVPQPLQTLISPSNTSQKLQASREPISKEMSATTRCQPHGGTMPVTGQRELAMSAFDGRELSTKDDIATKNQRETKDSDDRGNSVFYVPMPVRDRQNPPNYTEPPDLEHRNSASFTGISATNRRDSATSAKPKYERRDSATYTGMPVTCRRDSATYTGVPVIGRRDSATYTRSETPKDEPCNCKVSRSTSPANTEREISSLSDLPPEKDVKSSRGSPRPAPTLSPLSPGEEKFITATSTDTDTKTYEYGALSDGEIPQPTPHRTRKLSFGERSVYSPRPTAQTTNAHMEDTLNAISEELARCRKLLAVARDHEVRPFHWDRTS